MSRRNLRRATQWLTRFWRWFTAPTVSLARVVVILALVAAVNTLHVEAQWPWLAADAAVLAAFTVLAFAGELLRLIRR